MVLAAILVAPVTLAGDVELTPFVGMRFGGDFRSYATGTTYDLSGDADYGVVLDFGIGETSQIEALWSRQETKLGAEDLDVAIDYVQVGATYRSDNEKITPFVAVTLGATRFDPKRSGLSSATGFSFAIGGGGKFFLGRHVGIRLDGRLYGTLVGGGGGVFCGGGCTIAFTGNAFWQLELNAGLVFRF
jgi:hypothetical protein